MAKAQGFICDVCENFVTVTNGNRPDRWMRLSVASANPEDGFDICSNKCLAALGKDRYKAERETKTTKAKGIGAALVEQPTKSTTTSSRGGSEGIEGPNGKVYSPQNHARWHTDEPNPNCAYCVAETDPDNELPGLIEAEYTKNQ